MIERCLFEIFIISIYLFNLLVIYSSVYNAKHDA